MSKKCELCETQFEARAMGFRELAQFYCPNIKPSSASVMLRKWISTNKNLQNQLRIQGYKRYAKVLTPKQVETIAEHLGVP